MPKQAELLPDDLICNCAECGKLLVAKAADGREIEEAVKLGGRLLGRQHCLACLYTPVVQRSTPLVVTGPNPSWENVVRLLEG